MKCPYCNYEVDWKKANEENKLTIQEVGKEVAKRIKNTLMT